VKSPALEDLDLPEPLAKRLAAKGLTSLEKIESIGVGQLQHVEGVGPEGAEQVAAAIDAYRNAHGDELWRVMARTEALSDLDYGFFVNDLKAAVEPVLDHYRKQGVEGLDAVYTGLVPLVYKTQHELLRGLVESLLLAFALIAVVMIIVLRSPSAGLLAMIPNSFPVVVIFGLMGWLRIKVDIGSMMTFSVALGVAVDDTIHYLTWYRRGLDQGLNRKGAVMLAYERCATAMTQTTLIGGFGLAVFAFSTFTPTQRFGMLMLTLLVAALFGDLIFLPALLTGPLGRFFRGQRRRKAPDPSGDDTAGEPAGDEEDLHTVPDNGVLPPACLHASGRHQPQRAS
jgi:predicted RND superfamily exporter protein